MPDVVFYAPNAPQPCEGNPFGYQWFPVSRLDPALALAGVRSAAADVDAFLDQKMAEHGLDESKTALVGFSQGTMMALHVGLRRARPLAGIVGFSGMLAGPEVLKAEIKSRPPVLLTHGDKDEMLPHILSHRAAEVLQQHDVEGRPAHRRGHRPRHQRHGAVGRRALPDRGVQAADARNERRYLQARFRARRRSLPEELRRQAARSAPRSASPSAARPWSICGAARPTRRPARRGRRTRSASSSPAPRAPRRSAPTCWPAAASSTSTRRSPSCGRSSRRTARSARRRA